MTNDGSINYTRDAAGRLVQSGMNGSYSVNKFDGDGRLVRTSILNNNTESLVTYYLNSSVLGLAVSKLLPNGQRQESYVYAGGKKIATASPWQSLWTHEDPVTGSHGISSTQGYYGPDAEFSADGVNVGFAEPTSPAPEDSGFKYPEVAGSHDCYVGNPNCVTCYLDGTEHGCAFVSHLIDVGAARPCPNNDCGPVTARVDITYRSGRRESHTGLIDPFLLPRGADITFTGGEAVIAHAYFEFGMPDFESGVASALLHVFLSRMETEGNHFADPQNPQEPPGTPNFVNSKAVKACAEKYFQITLAGLDYQPGNGRISFQGFDEKQSSMFNSRSGWLYITPNDSKSSFQISQVTNAALKGGVAYGYTDPRDPSHPYVANDISGSSHYFWFIHELGNALAFLTGKYHVSWLTGEKVYDDSKIEPTAKQISRAGHNDPGVTFEDCVRNHVEPKP